MEKEKKQKNQQILEIKLVTAENKDCNLAVDFEGCNPEDGWPCNPECIPHVCKP